MLLVDEKGQRQALDRTQPGLPLKRVGAGIVTHDYKRNDTTTPLAASTKPARRSWSSAPQKRPPASGKI